MGLLMGIFIFLSIANLPYIQSRKTPCATKAPATYEESTSDEIPLSTSIETVTEAPIRHMRPQHGPKFPHPGKNITPDRSNNREPSSEIREVPLHGITKNKTTKPLTPTWDNNDHFVNPGSYQKSSPSGEVTEPEDPTRASHPNTPKESLDPSSEHKEPPPPPGLTRKQPSKSYRKKPVISRNQPYIQAIPYSPEGVHNDINPFLMEPEFNGGPFIEPDIIQVEFVEPSAIGTFDRSPVPPPWPTDNEDFPNYFVEKPIQRPKKPVVYKIHSNKPAMVPDRRPIRPKIIAPHHQQPVRQYRLKPDVKILPIAPFVPRLTTETPSTTTESPLTTNHTNPEQGREVEHPHKKPTEEPFEKLQPRLPPWGSNMQQNEPNLENPAKQNFPPQLNSKLPENPKGIINNYFGMPPLAGEMVPTAEGQYFPNMEPRNLMPQNPENYLFKVFRIPSVPAEGYKPENLEIDPGLIPTMMAGLPQGSKPEIYYGTIPRSGTYPYQYGPLFWPFQQIAPGSQKRPLDFPQGYPGIKWEPYLTELDRSKPFQNLPFQSKPITDLRGNAIPSTNINDILNNFQEPIGNQNTAKTSPGPLLQSPKSSMDRYPPLLRQTPNFGFRPWSKKPKDRITSHRIPGKYPKDVDDRTGERSQSDQMLPFENPELIQPRHMFPYRYGKRIPQGPSLEQLRNLPPGLARSFGLPEDQTTDHVENGNGPLFQSPNSSIDRLRYPPLLNFGPNFELRPWSNIPKKHTTSHRLQPHYPKEIDDRTGERSSPDQMLPFVSHELNFPMDIVPYRHGKKIPQWPSLEQLRNLPPGMARAFGMPEDQVTDHMENGHAQELQSPNSSMDRLRYPPVLNFGPNFQPKPWFPKPKNHLTSHRIPAKNPKVSNARTGERSQMPHVNSELNPSKDIVPYGYDNKMPQWPDFELLQNLPPGSARLFGMPEDQEPDHMENGASARKHSDMYDPHGKNPMMDPGDGYHELPMNTADLLDDKKFVINVNKLINMVAPVLRCNS